MANKLPAAKDWRNRPLETWNTSTFCAYLTDHHRELFGIDYAPMRGWRAEQGILGGLIGTAGKSPKPRMASNALVKAFIDETFASYTPTPEWPGTSFGFMWTYRKADWQRLQAAELARERRKTSVELAQQTAMTDDELEAWL